MSYFSFGLCQSSGIKLRVLFSKKFFYNKTNNGHDGGGHKVNVKPLWFTV